MADEDSIERWVAVPEYEGLYEVSSMGRLRSIDKTFVDLNGRSFFRRGVIRKPHLNKQTGYRMLCLKRGGVQKGFTVARIMARAFLGLSGSDVVDHIDRNRSNDRLENLRIASRTQNCFNRGMQKTNTSGFIGVSKDVNTGKWIAQLSIRKKNIRYKLFDTPEEAAEQYKKWSVEIHGEFSPFNTDTKRQSC